MPLPLRTARLELRDFRPDDFAAVHAYASDPLVTRFTSFGPNSEEETREFLARSAADAAERPRRFFALALVELATGNLVGGGGLLSRREFFQEYELGYVLHRDAWGRGLATEAAGALLAFGFGELGAHRLYATIDPGNTPSCRVVEKLGLRREGHFRQDVRVRGVWRDSLIYGILADEWAGERAVAGGRGAGAG